MVWFGVATILVTETGCDTLTNGIERKLFVK